MLHSMVLAAPAKHWSSNLGRQVAATLLGLQGVENA